MNEVGYSNPGLSEGESLCIARTECVRVPAAAVECQKEQSTRIGAVE